MTKGRPFNHDLAFGKIVEFQGQPFNQKGRALEVHPWENMSRSLKKGPYLDAKLLKKIAKLKPGDKTIIKTWARDCTITPEMVGFTFGVHNGKEHISVFVAEDMVGHKLGEFAPTRKFVRHGGRMQREQEAITRQKETAK